MATRRVSVRVAFGLLLVSVLVPTQVMRGEDAGNFSDRAHDPNLDTRKKQIEQELKTLKVDDWAGSYYYGDGLGVNVELSLAPEAGFVFTWNGCLGLYDLNYGDVKESGGRIQLVVKFPNVRRGFQGIAPEFLPIKWGRRHYLIPSDEVVEFANAINAGFEPRKGMWGRYLLKQRDASKTAHGYPNLPGEYFAYLLKSPIKAEISSIESSSTKDSRRVTTVKLNLGASQGVKSGMEFYLYAPSGLFESATITNVSNTSSEAEISQDGHSIATPPAVGWKLSTRAVKN